MCGSIRAEKFIRKRIRTGLIIIACLRFTMLSRFLQIRAQLVAARKIREKFVSNLARDEIVFGHQLAPIIRALVRAVELQQATHEIQVVWKAFVGERVKAKVKLRVER